MPGNLNLGEMDKFLEIYDLPKLNQEKTESPNRLITAGEIKGVIKKAPITQKPWTRCFHRRILQNNQERANPYPSQTIPKKSKKKEESQTLFTKPASS